MSRRPTDCPIREPWSAGADRSRNCWQHAAGTVTLGLLVTAAFLMPGADRSLVSRPGRRDLVLAAGAALLWAVAALATIVFTHATVVGQPLSEAMRPEVFFTYALEIPQNVAYLVTAVLALIISATAAVSVRSGSAAILTGVAAIALIAGPLTAHGTSLGDHSLALAAGAIHALAAALWVGGLIAIARHGLRRDPGFSVADPPLLHHGHRCCGGAGRIRCGQCLHAFGAALGTVHHGLRLARPAQGGAPGRAAARGP